MSSRVELPSSLGQLYKASIFMKPFEGNDGHERIGPNTFLFTSHPGPEETFIEIMRLVLGKDDDLSFVSG